MNKLRFCTFTRNGSRPVYARDNGDRKSGRTMPFQGRVCDIAFQAVTNHLAYKNVAPRNLYAACILPSPGSTKTGPPKLIGVVYHTLVPFSSGWVSPLRG